MKLSKLFGAVALTAIVCVFAPMSVHAYEVTILEDRGSEFKALMDGRYDVAIKRLELRLETRYKNRDTLLTNLCTAYVLNGDLLKAHDVCNEAVEADGKFVGTAYNSRGVLHAMMGDFISARVDFEEASRKSNYPAAPHLFGEFPAMARYNTPSANLDNAIEIAASNNKFSEERASQYAGVRDLDSGAPIIRNEEEDE